MNATMSQSSVRVTRKSLADQIDRLDTILDGLSEALNESVADAVRGVVGEAVRRALQEAVRLQSSADVLGILLQIGRAHV